MAKIGRAKDKKESTKQNLEITKFFASKSGPHFDASLYPPYGNFNTGNVHLGGTKMRKLWYSLVFKIHFYNSSCLYNKMVYSEDIRCRIVTLLHSYGVHAHFISDLFGPKVCTIRQCSSLHTK